jgi:hypothetical protein
MGLRREVERLLISEKQTDLASRKVAGAQRTARKAWGGYSSVKGDEDDRELTALKRKVIIGS